MKLTYRQQGYVFFLCQNIDSLTKDEQRKIRAVCDKTSFGNAVFDYITTDATSEDICKQYDLNDKLLSVLTAKVFRDLVKLIKHYKYGEDITE